MDSTRDSTSEVQDRAALVHIAAERVQQRRRVGLALVHQAEAIALACYAMAQR